MLSSKFKRVVGLLEANILGTETMRNDTESRIQKPKPRRNGTTFRCHYHQLIADLYLYTAVNYRL